MHYGTITILDDVLVSTLESISWWPRLIQIKGLKNTKEEHFGIILFFFFQPGFHPFPLQETERTSSVMLQQRGGREKGSELGQCQETHCGYSTSRCPLWGKNLTPPILALD
jgi:hypothetical protein